MADPETDDIPQGSYEPARHSGRMEKSDKILLWIIGTFFAAAFIALCFALKALLGAVGLVATGIGLGTALIVSIPLAVVLLLLLLLFSGDGLVGEFHSAVPAFFALVAFFTLTIAIVFQP